MLLTTAATSRWTKARPLGELAVETGCAPRGRHPRHAGALPLNRALRRRCRRSRRAADAGFLRRSCSSVRRPRTMIDALEVTVRRMKMQQEARRPTTSPSAPCWNRRDALDIPHPLERHQENVTAAPSAPNWRSLHPPRHGTTRRLEPGGRWTTSRRSDLTHTARNIVTVENDPALKDDEYRWYGPIPQARSSSQQGGRAVRHETSPLSLPRQRDAVIKAMEGYTRRRLTPLYDQAEIDANIAAERERCAKVRCIAYEMARFANSKRPVRQCNQEGE